MSAWSQLWLQFFILPPSKNVFCITHSKAYLRKADACNQEKISQQYIQFQTLFYRSYLHLSQLVKI